MRWGAREGRNRQPKPSTDISNSTNAGRQVVFALLVQQYRLAPQSWRNTVCSNRSVIVGRAGKWRTGASSILPPSEELVVSSGLPSKLSDFDSVVDLMQVPLGDCWCSQNWPERRRKSLKKKNWDRFENKCELMVFKNYSKANIEQWLK